MRSRGDGSLRILLDTSYFLPVFGIRVKGLDEKVLLALRDYALEGRIQLYYPSFMWLELLPKVYREARKRGLGRDVDAIIRRAVLAIVHAEYLHPVSPDHAAILVAWKLKLMGHEDMIDNMIFGVASSNKMILLSMDKELKNIADRLGGVKVFDHNMLLKLLEEG